MNNLTDSQLIYIQNLLDGHTKKQIKNRFSGKNSKTLSEIIDKILANRPVFIKGCLYLVKAFDHFTRVNDDVEQLFVEFVGFFIEETPNYYKFASFYFNESTTKKKFYTNEIRFVVKSAVFDYVDLKAKLECKKFDERILSERDE